MRNVNHEHKESLRKHEKVMLSIAGGVGTATFFVFCVLLTFTPLVFPSTLAVVQFISSAFLQLVLLPVILIAGNLQARHDQIRADADYETNIKAEKQIEEILKRLKK